MDISVYVSELLYSYDCVIIPEFGGFICSYRPSEIHPILHTITPPSKFISFNRSISSNDGLLVTHLSLRLNISYSEANALITGWVQASLALISNNDTLSMPGIGTFKKNVEGGIIFTPDDKVNYLKTSFGLKPIYAEPVIHNKQIQNLYKQDRGVTEEVKPKNLLKLRIAAVLLLLLSMAGILGLMMAGTGVKQLHLNEANVLSFINSFSITENIEIKPTPVSIADKTSIDIKKEISSLPESSQHSNYIIIGAFGNETNIAIAKQNLLTENPAATVLEEKIGTLTRIGYKVSSNETEAREQLTAARQTNNSYWLYRKAN